MCPVCERKTLLDASRSRDWSCPHGIAISTPDIMEWMFKVHTLEPRWSLPSPPHPVPVQLCHLLVGDLRQVNNLSVPHFLHLKMGIVVASD